jgi:hypothetical protein
MRDRYNFKGFPKAFSKVCAMVLCGALSPTGMTRESIMHDNRLLTDYTEELVAHGDCSAKNGSSLFARSVTRRRSGPDALLLLNRAGEAVPATMQDIIASSVASCIGIAPAGIARGEASSSRRRLWA